MDLEQLLSRANLRAILLRRSGSPDLVEDLCQDVVVKCLRYFVKNGAPPPISFIVRVGMNEYYSWVRKRKPRLLPEGFDQVSAMSDPAEEVEEKERAAHILSVLDALPGLYRDMLKLHLEGCCPSQIAQRTGLRLSTVRSRIHRARSLLKAKLQEHALN
jgi:RNA polymerase sigma-70 factor (ECF subfamily)